MGNVPQSYYLNPATQPECNVFIGIPAISQTSILINSSNLSISDLFWLDPLTDSIIHPFHPNADVDDFINKFDAVESFEAQASINLFSLGFRVKEMYFSFDATIKNSAEFTYPKDFVKFVIKGNENNETFDFSALATEIIDYSEFGFNISRKFGEQFQVGIRPKILFGLASVSTLSSNTTIQTSTDEWVVDADYKVRIAATGITIPVDENGLLDPNGEFEYDSTILSSDGYKEIFTDNIGFGIDLGAHYKPIETLQLSLSLLDLGYINWKENTHIASVNGTYIFKGIDPTVNDSIDPGQTILDSLKEDLHLTGTEGSFKTYLNPKLFVGMRYFLTPGLDIGILSRTEFNKSYINQDVILLADWHPFRMLSISGSYSILDKNNSSFGFGLGLNLACINIYAILDNVPLKYDILNTDYGPIPLAVDMQSYSISFGINLTFGCNQKKKLYQDRPLFNSSDWIL
jgi:hypothetical protein